MNGNEYARNFVKFIQTILETIGLEPERIHMIFVSAAEGERFKQLATEMDNKIRRLGPSKLRIHQQEVTLKAAAKAAKKAQKKPV